MRLGPASMQAVLGVEAGVDRGTIDAPTCPASCDDKNDCTTDSCDPNTFQCVHTAVADGRSCEDGSPCTIHDICQGGLCYSGPNRTCTATDQCHEAGDCSPRTGECSNPNSQNGKSCDDGLKCTTGDQCLGGVCQGQLFCPSFATCDPATGFCQGTNGASVFPTALADHFFEHVSGEPTNGNGLVRSPDGQIFVAGRLLQHDRPRQRAHHYGVPERPEQPGHFHREARPEHGRGELDAGVSWFAGGRSDRLCGERFRPAWTGGSLFGRHHSG